MRIATFNILGGRSPVDGRVDLARFGRAIRDLDADLLGLQEVDLHQPRSHRADLTEIAAEAMGASYHVFVAALTGLPGEGWTAATGREPPGTPSYGIAFLSRYAVTSSRVVRLPGAPVPVPYRSDGRVVPVLVRDEARVAVVAEVATPLGPLEVVTTHLSFVRPWNRHQLRRLRASLGPPHSAVVLMGDLNLPARAAERTTRMSGLAHGATFPAHAPREQLDHILSSGGLGTPGLGTPGLGTPGLGTPVGRVVELPLSDHRALVADL